MSKRDYSAGPRIKFREESYKADGTLRHKAGYFIQDGTNKVSIGSGILDREFANLKLAEYIQEKHQPIQEKDRHPTQVKICDVINYYARTKATEHKKPEEFAYRARVILEYVGGDTTVSKINADWCKMYLKSNGENVYANRQLKDIRAALNHYRRAGYISEVPALTFGKESRPRPDWLTRSQAARLLWAAYRMRQSWKGQESDRRTGAHLAKFILIGLYTGTRSGAICGAAFEPNDKTGHIDLEEGIFHRKSEKVAETKKRQPDAPINDRLLAHIRRWHAKGLSENYVIEWNGVPVKSVKKAFRTARIAAGLGPEITPHILRHTAATWLMKNPAVTVWQAAGLLGMSVETLVNVYGHHDIEHTREAANALAKKPKSNVIPLRRKQAA